jgi:uncharacterized protein involved in type VI secretion and phage assembly
MTGLRWVHFESAALDGLAYEVMEVDGGEELNRLFRFTVRLVLRGLSDAPALARELLSGPAALVFEESGAEVTRVHGLVAALRSTAPTERDVAALSVTIAPRAGS